MAVSIWQILTAIAPILAPVISLVLVLIGRVIWNHEQRIRSLEQSKTRHGRTLYGDDDDLQQTGLSHDLKDVLERLDRVERKLDKLNGDHDDWPGDDD
jgi:hypothetical protein